MRFESIQGQEIPMGILKRALEKGRVPTAYLFTGPEGCGRTMAATAMAASLNCESGPLACGTCPSCRLYKAGNHPDFHQVEPAPGKRWIEIKQVREGIIAKAFLKPMKGRSLTFVIQGAHLLHPHAANAFLKTLEEPPEATRFILIAPQKGAVLPTIASRCQVIPFKPLPKDILRSLLEDRGIEAREANVLAAMAGGSLTKALGLHEEGLSRGMEGELSDLLAIGKSSPSKILDFSQRWGRNRQDALKRLEQMAQWYRDLLFIAEGGQDEQILTLSGTSSLKEAARELTNGEIAAVCENIEEARESLEANTNIQLTLDRLLFSIRKHTGAGEKRV